MTADTGWSSAARSTLRPSATVAGTARRRRDRATGENAQSRTISLDRGRARQHSEPILIWFSRPDRTERDQAWNTRKYQVARICCRGDRLSEVIPPDR
jgi:hypothetical protein